MKDETILIRLDTELKEAFKTYCKEHKTTMSKEVSKWINNTLMSEKVDSDKEQLLFEVNYYSKEYYYMKDKIEEISKISKTLSARLVRHNMDFYESLLYKHFHEIPQFKNYELLTAYNGTSLAGQCVYIRPKEEIKEKVLESLKEFNHAPLHLLDALALDKENKRLVQITFIPSIDGMLHNINARIKYYDDCLTVYILISNKNLREWHILNQELKVRPERHNGSYVCYTIDDLFHNIIYSTGHNIPMIDEETSVHPIVQREGYWGRKRREDSED